MVHVVRTIVLVATFWLCFAGPSRADVPPVASPAAPACTPAGQCCKVCDKGQACGDTCISRAKQCHKGRGCACNADEVCGKESESQRYDEKLATRTVP
jgi:hypothetical protein